MIKVLRVLEKRFNCTLGTLYVMLNCIYTSLVMLIFLLSCVFIFFPAWDTNRFST